MKNRKKFLILLLCILFCLLILSIIQIYAKYLTSAAGDTSISVAKWNIRVNNLSIKNNADISSAVIPVFTGNENIAPNIIAPTAEGYIDLDFDFTDADVSFKYEITTSVDENSSVKDLVATGYSIDDGEKVNFSNFNDPISETISLNSNIKRRKYRLFLLWNDDENTAQMSNADDTSATKNGQPALFRVNISFTQIAD